MQTQLVVVVVLLEKVLVPVVPVVPVVLILGLGRVCGLSMIGIG